MKSILRNRRGEQQSFAEVQYYSPKFSKLKEIEDCFKSKKSLNNAGESILKKWDLQNTESETSSRNQIDFNTFRLDQTRDIAFDEFFEQNLAEKPEKPKPRYRDGFKSSRVEKTIEKIEKTEEKTVERTIKKKIEPPVKMTFQKQDSLDTFFDCFTENQTRRALHQQQRSQTYTEEAKQQITTPREYENKYQKPYSSLQEVSLPKILQKRPSQDLSPTSFVRKTKTKQNTDINYINKPGKSKFSQYSIQSTRNEID